VITNVPVHLEQAVAGRVAEGEAELLVGDARRRVAVVPADERAWSPTCATSRW
jgi:hypothetical protein